MRQSSRQRTLAFACSLLSALLCSPFAVVAQEQWPVRPVTVVVPFPAGGGVDVLMRTLAAKMAELSGQPFIVENKTGATGTIGSGFVSRAVPDGYTLGTMNFAAHAVGPQLPDVQTPYRVLPIMRGITPISVFFGQAAVLVVRDDVPANDLRGFITLASKKPGHFAIANTGIGATSWLSAKSFARSANIDLLDVQYKGDAPALQDLLNGTVHAYFGTVTAMRPHIESGKIRALGVSSAEPNDALPGVAPIGSILPGFRHTTWNGLCGPEGMSPMIVEQIAALAQKAVNSPDVIAAFKRHGVTATPMGPVEAAAFLAEEAKTVRPILEAAGLKVQ